MKFKKDLFPLFLIFIISLIAVYPLMKPGMFYTHDGEVHISRLAQFYMALKDGHFPVRWQPNEFFGLGYPAFNFTYVFPYYLGAAFRFITGTSFQNVFKILLGLSFILSGFTAYLFFRKKFTSLSGLVATVAYLWTPYRFANLYTRGALGEAFAFIFIPLLFYGVELFSKKRLAGLIVTAFTVFLFLTSHPQIGILFISIAVIYAYLEIKNKKICLLYYLSILFGFLLSAFYLIPLIFDKSFTIIDTIYLDIWRNHFYPLVRLLRLPFAGVDTGTPFQVGVPLEIIIIISTILFIRNVYRKEKNNPTTLFFTITCLLAIMLASSFSYQIWANLTFLKYLIFPWRFLGLIVFLGAYLLGYLLTLLKGRQRFIGAVVFILLSIFTSRHYLRTPVSKVIADAYYENFGDPESYDKYFLPTYISPDIQNSAAPFVENIGEGTLTIKEKKSIRISAVSESPSDFLTKFSILYFPGWQVLIDGKKTDIQYQFQTPDHDFRGLIVVKIPQGNHQLELKFAETKLKQVANFISLSSLVAFGFFIILVIYRNRRFRRIKSHQIFSV